jgi:endonuclease/exonuclease/phosphatase (EEP) superfamily protein YafD
VTTNSKFYVLAALLSILCLASGSALLAGQFGEYNWRLDRLSHFSFYYLIVLLVAGPLLIFLRFRIIGLAFLGPALIGLWIMGPYLVPHFRFQTEAPNAVRLINFNVNTANTYHDDVITYLLQSGANIVVLLEVNELWIQRLDRIKADFVYHFEHPRSDNFGLAVYSKYTLKNPSLRYLGAAGVPSLEITVEPNGEETLLFVMHTVPPIDSTGSGLRDEQLREMAKLLAAKTGDKILTGDLNITPWSPIYRDFERRSAMSNCAKRHGVNATWPTTNMTIRIPIDHCLVAGELEVMDVSVGPDLGSDHFPLIVEIDKFRTD